MRVLIALDATPQCSELVEAVAQRPWPADTKFLLVHVLDPFPFAKVQMSLQRVVKASEEKLQSVCKPLCSKGWNVEREVVLGRARQAITKVAESWKSDLIVVGSNETTALTRLLLGSTARAVLQHAPCSVEVVRRASAQKANRDSGTRILVATDGSECSVVAVRTIAGWPWPEGTVAKVISLPEPFLPVGAFAYLDLREIESQNGAAAADAQRYAAAGAEMLQAAGLKVACATPEPCDSDAQVIVKEAQLWKADMIVVGSHGRRGFDRLAMGSVSEHVALHAPCSVLVIRRPKAAKENKRGTTKKGAKP